MLLSAISVPRPGVTPYDRALTDLVGELHLQRAIPRALGRARREVLPQRRRPSHHPLVGDLTLSYEALKIPADPGQTIVAYTAEPDSPSQQAGPVLKLDVDAGRSDLPTSDYHTRVSSSPAAGIPNTSAPVTLSTHQPNLRIRRRATLARRRTRPLHGPLAITEAVPGNER